MIGKTFLYTTTFSLTFLVLAGSGEPQEAPSQEYSYDNGYIRATDGDVSLQRAENPEPEPGAINLPVLPGDRVWTTGSSFAEIRLADGTQLQLGEDTKIDFMAFGIEPSVRLWNGSVLVTVSGSSRVRIDTPSGSVYQESAGSHRVDVRDGLTTSVTVFQGSAELASEQSSVVIGAGQRSVLEAGGVPENPFAFGTSTGDGLDTWSRERQRSAPRPREVPLPELTGEVHHYVDDLDAHGTWDESEELGSVWYPSVGTGWAPYRDGRWCYTSYGYTWVSYETWGWAPYHYGRWGHNPRGWYWVPGRQWSPAWVSFAVGPAWIGWSPLGYYGGPVFAYDRAYYGAGYYPNGNERRYHRGGKAVPRHVYDNGAGWNFAGKEHFRGGGKARLRAADVRSTSARARIANQGAVLDRNLTPRGIDSVTQRAPRPRPFANQPVARSTAGRARGRVSPGSADPLSRTSASSVPNERVESSVRQDAQARQRNTGRARTATRTGQAEPPRGFETTEPRTGSRVFRTPAATRSNGSEVRVPETNESARRRTTPTRVQPAQTSPQRSDR